MAKIYKYLLVIDGDGGCFGAGEIAVVELDRPIEEEKKEDKYGRHVILRNGDRIDYFFAHTEEDIAKMFKEPHCNSSG